MAARTARVTRPGATDPHALSERLARARQQGRASLSAVPAPAPPDTPAADEPTGPPPALGGPPHEPTSTSGPIAGSSTDEGYPAQEADPVDPTGPTSPVLRAVDADGEATATVIAQHPAPPAPAPAHPAPAPDRPLNQSPSPNHEEPGKTAAVTAAAKPDAIAGSEIEVTGLITPDGHDRAAIPAIPAGQPGGGGVAPAAATRRRGRAHPATAPATVAPMTHDVVLVRYTASFATALMPLLNGWLRTEWATNRRRATRAEFLEAAFTDLPTDLDQVRTLVAGLPPGLVEGGLTQQAVRLHPETVNRLFDVALEVKLSPAPRLLLWHVQSAALHRLGSALGLTDTLT